MACYFDWKAGKALDPVRDGCPFNLWQERYEDFPFAVHEDGFLIFLTPQQIESFDEYRDGDPYSVDWESSFHQARRDCALELLSSVPGLQGGGCRILDLGCGQGQLTAAIKVAFPQAEVSGLDCSLTAIREARTNVCDVDFVLADAYSPPYPQGYFDVVLALNIWEHVPDPLRLLKAAARVLKPTGSIIISTPSRYRIGNAIRVLRGKPVVFQSAQHVTEYSVGQVKEQLRFGGFGLAEVRSPPVEIRARTMREFLAYKVLLRLARVFLRAVHSEHVFETTVFFRARRSS